MDTTKVLDRARKAYGNKNQILVVMEELNELACVLAKFGRYDNEDNAVTTLHDKVLDEVADVYIVLEHVKAIFKLGEEELTNRENIKLERVGRWLDTGGSMEQTTRDRELIPPEVIKTFDASKSCFNCRHLEKLVDSEPCNVCSWFSEDEGKPDHWEPTLASGRFCSVCVHYDTPIEKEPCSDCFQYNLGSENYKKRHEFHQK